MLKFKMIKIQQKGYFNSIHEFHFFENKVLGHGSFGLVLLATHIRTCKLYAIKIINLNKIPQQHALQTIENQNRIHGKLEHPHIVKLWDSILDDHRLYMIMEYVDSGSLFHHQNACEKFSEVQAFKYFYQTLQAIKYLHCNSIIHRDLKPQNLLLDSNYNIKLCDMGWATKHLSSSASKRNTFCGTYEYMAPQIIFQKDYDQQVDVWALGVLLFELLHGHAPFQGQNLQDVRHKMVNGGYQLSREVSQECKQLMISILKFEPEERLTIEQIEKHVWLTKMQKQLTAIYIQNEYYSSPDNLTKLKLQSNISHPSPNNSNSNSNNNNINNININNKQFQHYRNNTQTYQTQCIMHQNYSQLDHSNLHTHCNNRHYYNQSIHSNLTVNDHQKLGTFLDGFVASTSNTIDVSNCHVKDKDKGKGKQKGNKKMSVDSNVSLDRVDQKNKQDQVTPQTNKLINIKQRVKKSKQKSKQKLRHKKSRQKYEIISIHQNRLTPPDLTVFNSITEHELENMKDHELFTRRKTNVTHDKNPCNKTANKRCKTVMIGIHDHSENKDAREDREQKEGRVGGEKKKDKKNKDKDKDKLKQKKQLTNNRNLTPIHSKKKSQDILSTTPAQFSIYVRSKRRVPNNSKSKSKSKERVYQKEPEKQKQKQKQKEKILYVAKNSSTKNLAKNSSQSNLFGAIKKKQQK